MNTIGYNVTLSFLENGKPNEMEMRDVYFSNGAWNKATDKDEFGVPDEDIFFYLSSQELKIGEFEGEFYIHAFQEVKAD